MKKSLFFLVFIFPFCVYAQLNLDTSYANQGINVTGLQSYDTYTGGGLGISNSPYFMSDNSILVLYTMNPYYSPQSTNLAPTIGIKKYLENGSLDSSFGTNGTALVTSNFHRDRFEVYGVTIQPDGKIILVGRQYLIGVFSRDYKVFICRLNADGTKDTTFATNGFNIINLYVENSADTNDERFVDVKVDSQNRVIAVGYIYWDIGVNAYDSAATAIRFLPNGTVDTTFANNGTMQLSLSGLDSFSTIYQTSDDKFILFGSTNTAISQLLVAKIDSNGILDPLFGTNGITNIDFGGNTASLKIFFEPDNKMMLTGQKIGAGIAFAKINTDGTLDTSFSEDGKNITIIPVPNHQSVGYASYPGIGSDHIARLPDNKYIIASTVRISNTYNYTIVRLNEDTSKDNSFMTNGVYLNDIVAFDWARAAHVQNDGKLTVLVGSTLFKYQNFSVLGTQDIPISSSRAINVYPNPTKEVLYINQLSSKITVFDVSGKKLETYKNTDRIVASGLKSGIYFVEIELENGFKEVKKVVKE